MSHLVRDQPFAVANVSGGVGEKRVVGKGGRAGVLHAARDEVIHTNLVVLGPGIRQANFPLEKLHDVPGVAKGAERLANLGGRSQKREFHVVVLVLDPLEIAGHQRDEIIGVGLFLGPVEGDQSGDGVLGFGNQSPVGDHSHAVGNMAGHLGGEFFVGRVKTGVPMTRLDGLALGEQMGVAFLVAHLGRAEIKSEIGLRVVGDGDRGLAVRRHRSCEGDDEMVARDLPGLNLLGGGDGMNIQAHRVERQFTGRFDDRFEADDGRGLDRPLLEIRRHVQDEMQNLDLLVGGVFAMVG